MLVLVLVLVVCFIVLGYSPSSVSAKATEPIKSLGLPDEKRNINMINSAGSGDSSGNLDHTLLFTKVLDLKVSFLCRLMSCIGNLVSEINWKTVVKSASETWIRKHVGQVEYVQGLTTEASLPQIKDHISEVITDFLTINFAEQGTIDESSKRQHIYNCVYDLKRCLDAGQVNVAKWLTTPSLTLSTKYAELQNDWYRNPSGNEFNNWVILSYDVLCYLRAKLEEVNVVFRSEPAMLNMSQGFDYDAAITKLQTDIIRD